MRFRGSTGRAAVLAAAVLAFVASGCKDSNSVAGPGAAMPAAAAASVVGTWTGTFQPDSPKCTASSATAEFQQTGTRVTGTFSTASCGISGIFEGTMTGNQLVGKIAMQGCTGGGVAGNVNGPAVSLTVGDLTKPLVTGDEIVMYGGVLSLHR